jgi:hypothetical protein
MSQPRILVDHGNLALLNKALPALGSLYRPLNDFSTGTCVRDSNVIVFPYRLQNVIRKTSEQREYANLTSGFIERLRNLYASILYKDLDSTKRIVFFIGGDIEIDLPPSRLFHYMRFFGERTDSFRNRIVVPHYTPDLSEFENLPMSEHPKVGFCGYAAHPSRRSLIESCREAPEIEDNFILRDCFMGNMIRHAEHKSKVDEYWENISSSHFTICSRGNANYSMRFYHTISSGRIPILIDTDMVFPWEKTIDYSQFVISEKTPTKVLATVMDWWSTKDIAKIQNHCRRIWLEELAPMHMAKQLTRWAESVL